MTTEMDDYYEFVLKHYSRKMSYRASNKQLIAKCESKELLW